MQIFSKTDKGMKREFNEDSFITGEFSENSCFAVVCDGMGGRNGGEIASKKAVEIIADSFKKSFSVNMKNSSIRYLLESAVTNANDAIFKEAQNDSALNGMGTTVIAAVVYDNYLYLAHAGDSRAYLLRNKNLYRLTVDHSVVQTMVDSGQITEEMAKSHPNKNIITRALGVDKNILIDLNELCLQKNDVILLCSDGLTNFVEESKIAEILNKNKNENSLSELIGLANAAGGGDNITVVTIII